MANKRIKRKSNTTLRIYADGGGLLLTPLIQVPKGASAAVAANDKLQPIMGAASKGGIGASGAMGIASGAMNVLGEAIGQSKIADTSGLEDNISNTKNMVVSATNNDELMNEWGSFNKLGNVNWKDIRGGGAGKAAASAGKAALSGASAGMAFGPIGAAAGAVIGGIASGIGSLFGRRKAKRKAKRLNRQINEANERALSSFETRASNIDTLNDLNLLANYSAYGGLLGILGGLALNYELANRELNNKEIDAMSKLRIVSMPNSFLALDEENFFAKGGGIHIKPENKGKFTSYCGGKVTAACIAKGKKSSSPTIRKRATFALNARKWKHAFGGYLFDLGGNLYTNISNIGLHGAEFSNGVTVIGNGGTHEENPLQGVPMGMDEQGVPNLVEEGEVKFNDYMFSNRLFADGGLLATYNLPTSMADHSFADIAEKLSLESSERPNDPISKRGLLNSMTKLQLALEAVKMADTKSQQGTMFAKGGLLPDNYDNVLLVDPYDFEGYEDEEQAINQPSRQSRGFGLDALRYAPALGAGIGVFTDLIGATNKPNYDNADLILNASREVEFNPIGNYLSYNPFDRDFYINKLNANSAASRRAVQNTSGGNRAQAQAGILAADYNYGQNLGDLARKAEEFNLAQKQQVEQFNRGTNQYNSEGAMRAAIANNEDRVRGAIAAAQLRDLADVRSSAARSANLTNFFDSLGDIGREEFSRNMIESNPALYYSIDRSGNVSYKNNEGKKKKSNKKSKGGKLKGGLTHGW